LTATRELLAEEGFAETTILAVARRAGVGAPAIYRRWQSRIELIEDAVFAEFDEIVVPDGVDLAACLQQYVDAFYAHFSAPATRAALPGLWSQQSSHYRWLGVRLGDTDRAGFRDLLRSFSPDVVDPSVDPDSILDMLVGSVLHQVFVLPHTGRPRRPTYATEVLVRALNPGHT